MGTESEVIEKEQRFFKAAQQSIQNGIKWLPDNLKGELSDGYHTFDELYDHRITLYIALCKYYKSMVGIWHQLGEEVVWRSKAHSDGSVWVGWFLLGIHTEPGKQITYHLPMSRWDECGFARELEKAPEFDGHTSADVLERLKQL